MRQNLAFGNFPKSTIGQVQAVVAFENFPRTHGNFPNLVGACMATGTQKTKTTLYWMDGDHYKLTVAFLRCDSGEHVLPIIQRLRWYAQLAGWIANPRYLYVVYDLACSPLLVAILAE
jgi:hypothetical protein